MTPYFKSFLYAGALIALGFVIGTVLLGCSDEPSGVRIEDQHYPCMPAEHDYAQTPDGHRWYLDCVNRGEVRQEKSQSWDQENLKKNDQGCPTAVYVAPNGNLTQCQLSEAAEAPKDTTNYFKSADAAAIYVVGKIYALSHYYEYGGVIVKTPKGYAYARPATQHHGMDVEFNQDPETFDGYPIVATYHVHPCLKDAFPSVFSPQDLSSSRTANHPGYVLDECTGLVHYWAPGDGYMDEDAMLKLGVSPAQLSRGVQISLGRVVGGITVDGVVIN